MTYGIIFYEINNNTKNIYLYLYRNSNEVYQDITISELNDIELLQNINIIYYVKNPEMNHKLYLLDITKYNNLFDKYKIKLEKINYEIFNRKIFHNNIKHRRIKNFMIKKELDLIILNYRLVNKFRRPELAT
jgi:hypothetical protein